MSDTGHDDDDEVDGETANSPNEALEDELSSLVDDDGVNAPNVELEDELAALADAESEPTDELAALDGEEEDEEDEEEADEEEGEGKPLDDREQDRLKHDEKLDAQEKLGDEKLDAQEKLGDEKKLDVQEKLENEKKLDAQEKLGDAKKLDVQEKREDEKIDAQEKLGDAKKLDVQKKLEDEKKLDTGNQPAPDTLGLLKATYERVPISSLKFSKAANLLPSVEAHADPPWDYRNDQLPYPSMSLDDLMKLDVASLAHEDGCLLWLWTTMPLIREGVPHRLLEAWGFKWMSEVVWKKPDQNGTGHHLRVVCEVCVLARRGKTESLNSNVLGFLEAAPSQRRHSQKPDEMYDLIERCSPGPSVELFARPSENHPLPECWSAWGNEGVSSP